jgi:hypothetical protein
LVYVLLVSGGKIIPHQRTNGHATRCNELARVLADIDRLLAEAEVIAAEDPEDRDRALELLIEFQDRKRDVEAKLRGER